MIVRLIGGGLLLLCGGLWAREQERAARTELARIEGFAALFAHIGEQVDAFCLPLDEIWVRLPADLRVVCGLGEDTASAALEVAISAVKDTAAARVLRHAQDELGRGGREDQVRLCRTVAGVLTERAAKIGGTLPRDSRARHTLVLTGCALCILLLW